MKKAGQAKKSTKTAKSTKNAKSAKPAKTARSAKPGKEAFERAFSGLREILREHVGELVVSKDTPAVYYLDSKKIYKKRPVMFGAVRIGKAYVSYHLFPLYVPGTGLHAGMSGALKKRMQGKTCFNFQDADAALFEELRDLTRRAVVAFRKPVPFIDG